MLSKESEQYKRCMELLPLVLDSEASHEDTNFFHHYIQNWPEVIDCYQHEMAFRKALKDKLGKFVAPSELHSVIREYYVTQSAS